MNKPDFDSELEQQIQNTTTAESSRKRLIVVIIVLAATSLLYRILDAKHLEQSAALFIGLPTFLAIASTYIQAESATGMSLKTVTIFLCMSGILLGEGMICILMAAPIFFAAALLYGLFVDLYRNRKKNKEGPDNDKMMMGLLALPFFMMSLEGIHPALSLEREEIVVVEHTVALDESSIQSNLTRPLQFSTGLPQYLLMGFPRPVASSGHGLKVGDVRVVHFAGGEGVPGDLAVRIIESSDGHIKMSVVEDTSKVAHWLKWESATIDWHASVSGRSSVRVELRYRRLLDPAWYFRPWERYAVRLAGEYLIRANAGEITE